MMLNYLVRRLIIALVAIFVLATVTFFLMHAVPGGPFDNEKPLPPAVARVVGLLAGTSHRNA